MAHYSVSSDPRLCPLCEIEYLPDYADMCSTCAKEGLMAKFEQERDKKVLSIPKVCPIHPGPTKSVTRPPKTFDRDYVDPSELQPGDLVVLSSDLSRMSSGIITHRCGLVPSHAHSGALNMSRTNNEK